MLGSPRSYSSSQSKDKSSVNEPFEESKYSGAPQDYDFDKKDEDLGNGDGKELSKNQK